MASYLDNNSIHLYEDNLYFHISFDIKIDNNIFSKINNLFIDIFNKRNRNIIDNEKFSDNSNKNIIEKKINPYKFIKIKNNNNNAKKLISLKKNRNNFINNNDRINLLSSETKENNLNDKFIGNSLSAINGFKDSRLLNKLIDPSNILRDYRFSCNFKIEKSKIDDNQIEYEIYFDNKNIEKENNFLNFVEIKNTNKILLNPEIKYKIDKNNILFDIKSFDKNSNQVIIFINKNNSFEFYKTISISENKNFIFYIPNNGNLIKSIRFISTNESGFISPYFRDIEINYNKKILYDLFVTQKNKNSLISINNIKNIVSFQLERKTIFPFLTEFEKISKLDVKNNNSVEYNDKSVIFNSLYEYRVIPVTRNGVRDINNSKTFNFSLDSISEYETKTKITNLSLNNSNISFNIESKSDNLDDIITDFNFNKNQQSNSVLSLNSKTDIDDERVKRFLRKEEYENTFIHLVEKTNKLTGEKQIKKILSKNVNFDFKDENENDKVSSDEIVIKTIKRNNNIFNSSLSKFYHPYVRRFGSITKKDIFAVKNPNDDITFGDLTNVNILESTLIEKSNILIDNLFYYIENYDLFFSWKIIGDISQIKKINILRKHKNTDFIEVYKELNTNFGIESDFNISIKIIDNKTEFDYYIQLIDFMDLEFENLTLKFEKNKI